MANFPGIPGYKIKKKLGQGGMATVYLGVPDKVHRMVAIKLLSALAFDNPRMAKRFTKEARTLSRLHHPNIVTIYEVGQLKDCHFIVMEYLQDNLKDRIKKYGRLSPEEALHITAQIADALFYAHDKNIIHRDIKPDNIMFRTDGTPVVLDFGIAKHLDSKTKITRTGTSIGTPLYMSPEQCNAESVDGRSDIYALGVVLFEMLTGKPPYQSTTTMGIVRQHLQDDSPKLPKKLQSFQPIIDKMMAKQRKRRVRSKNSLNDIIKDLLNINTGKIKIDMNQLEKIAAKKKGLKNKSQHTPKTIEQIKSKPKSPAKKSTPTVKRNPAKNIPVKKKRSSKGKKKNKHTLRYVILTLVAIFTLLLFIDGTRKIIVDFFTNLLIAALDYIIPPK
ncbi:MAG: serine/threonine protein kinase [bacterium]|nr:serine/threonine protein kinase [bacterium]